MMPPSDAYVIAGLVLTAVYFSLWAIVVLFVIGILSALADA